MEFILNLIPDGLALWAAAAVVIAAFFTAALTAAFGLGGGLALLAVMSAMLPAPAVIPIHGLAQLGSNAGRFYLQRHDVMWKIVLWFSAGGLAGALLGGRLAVEMPVWLLRAGVALFILYTMWAPRPRAAPPGVKTYVATGAVAAFLTMFFGATGPIAATMLSATKLGRLNVTATHAACMVAQHSMKILIFGLLGFAYGAWALLTAAIIVAGLAGTAMGTHFLRKMPEQTFRKGFKAVLTTIAAYLLASAAYAFKTG